MKKTILILFVLCITSLISLTAQTVTTQVPVIPVATAKNNVFKVKVGFHCANGKKLLEAKLSEVNGVTKVVADVETKIVTIEHNSELVTTQALVEAIEKIGYLTEYSDPNKPINKACSHGDGNTEKKQ